MQGHGERSVGPAVFVEALRHVIRADIVEHEFQGPHHRSEISLICLVFPHPPGNNTVDAIQDAPRFLLDAYGYRLLEMANEAQAPKSLVHANQQPFGQDEREVSPDLLLRFMIELFGTPEQKQVDALLRAQFEELCSIAGVMFPDLDDLILLFLRNRHRLVLDGPRGKLLLDLGYLPRVQRDREGLGIRRGLDLADLLLRELDLDPGSGWPEGGG